ncbi:MAG TPA: hypothetical protein VFP58_00340 [Candidatus Eisenbacteria bacterium]|nr:hypothetical protein [Candidatus Eisenbacteria bacterium]
MISSALAIAWAGPARAVASEPAGTGIASGAILEHEAWQPLAAIYGDRILADASGASMAQEPATPQAEPSASPASSSGGAKPFLYSILLPGMGQLAMGEKGHAIPFFIAEGLIWTNFIYWKVAEDKRQDDYIEQAQLNAGVDVSEAEDDYWGLVGQYSRSSGEGPNSYEEELRREARDLHPSDPAAQDAYVAENLPSGDQAWEWSTEELRSQYKDTRESANSADHKAKFSFAAALVNRVVSVIDVQLLRKKQKNASSARVPKPETRIYADALEGGGRLVVERRF